MMDQRELEQYLRDVRGKRGYLLPHHGLMAVSMPGLLQAYDEMYTQLALTPHHLNRHDHEFVWLGVLIAMREALGTHHIQRFREAGGSDDEVAAAMAVSMLAEGAGAYGFVDDHWLPHLPEFSPRRHYVDAFRQFASRIGLRLAHLTACAVQACLGNLDALRWQIAAAYEDGTNELELAEAMALTLFPGSVPNYVEAAGVWREMILAGEVKASELFATWARLSHQGGYDEAAGIVVAPA